MVYSRIKELNPEKIFTDVFVISAIKNEGIKELMEYLINKAIPREWEYHSDMKCDQSEFMRVVEIIREKLFIRFNQEIPYLVKQLTSGWEITKKGDLNIQQTLYVLKDSQKAMLIGKSGYGLRFISQSSSIDLERIFGRKVNLFIYIKTVDNMPADAV